MVLGVQQVVGYLALWALCAQGKPTEKKERVHHEAQLSDKVHDDAQNFDYDHDAKIVSKIDADKDGLVTVEELKAWIKFAQKRWIYEDVERQWKGHDLNGDGLVSWEEYKNATYSYVLDTDKDGFVTEGELKDWIKKAQKKYVYENVARQWQEYDLDQDGLISWAEYRNVTYGTYLDDADPDDGFNYKQMMVRDERRFKMADKDGDLIATKEDHDGDTEEPEWVKTEREQFVEFRDKNHDGKMDKEETKDWILPSDYDHAEAEARHLVYESDKDKGKEEIRLMTLIGRPCVQGFANKARHSASHPSQHRTGVVCSHLVQGRR
ncbi:hypothetical protein Chor_008170 [Crotalus horridus]